MLVADLGCRQERLAGGLAAASLAGGSAAGVARDLDVGAVPAVDWRGVLQQGKLLSSASFEACAFCSNDPHNQQHGDSLMCTIYEHAWLHGSAKACSPEFLGVQHVGVQVLGAAEGGPGHVGALGVGDVHARRQAHVRRRVPPLLQRQMG